MTYIDKLCRLAKSEANGMIVFLSSPKKNWNFRKMKTCLFQPLSHLMYGKVLGSLLPHILCTKLNGLITWCYSATVKRHHAQKSYKDLYPVVSSKTIPYQNYEPGVPKSTSLHLVEHML